MFGRNFVGGVRFGAFLVYYIGRKSKLYTNIKHKNQMKKRMKTLVALFVGAMFSLPSVGVAQTFGAGGIGYHVLSTEEHTVEVYQIRNGYHGSVNIPATVTYRGTTYDVVALGELAFYGSTLTSVTIPSSVTRIEDGCFWGSDGPASIDIPASVTEIGLRAFAANGMTTINVDEGNEDFCSVDGMLFSKDTTNIIECPSGKVGAVALPQKTHVVWPCAFWDCKMITAITLPEGVDSIYDWAFVNASSLESLTIPSTVTLMGYAPFAGCTSLDDITLAEGNSRYYLDGLMLYTMGGDTLLSCHKSGDSVMLPSTLRVVNGFLFNNDVRYVHVPEGVVEIGGNAFGLSSLRSIDLPSEMEVIGHGAFSECESLTHVGMPSRLAVMQNNAFGSTALTSIEIPDGLRVIPDGAFYSCGNLSQIVWGDAVEVIGNYAFSECALEELHLPSTLRMVADGSFYAYEDETLKRVFFSAPVDTLGFGVFENQSLKVLRLMNTVPPVATLPMYAGHPEYGFLYNTEVDSIIVPCGSMSAYLDDEYWGQYADKFYEDCDGIDEVGKEDGIMIKVEGRRIVVEGAESEEIQVFDVEGRRVESNGLESGVYLVKVGYRPAKKVFVFK